MLCGCIRFTLRRKPSLDGYESPSTLGEMSISESTRFDRSGAPSPPDRNEISIQHSESLVGPNREVVMEPSVEARFQALNGID